MSKKDTINKQLNDMQTQKANNIISAVNGVSSAASDISGNSGLDDIQLWKKK